MSIGAQASEFVFERIPVLLLCGLWFLLLAGLIFSDLVASIQFFKVTVENEGKATISDICLEAGEKSTRASRCIRVMSLKSFFRCPKTSMPLFSIHAMELDAGLCSEPISIAIIQGP